MRIIAGLTTLLAALVIYLPSFKAPFIYDDVPGIVKNDYLHIKSLSLGALKGAAFQDFKQNRPLTNLSFGLNYFFNGLNPFGYHLVNFAFFLLTALGIFLFIQKILSLRFDRLRASLAAWASTLVWVAHPINIQAAAYISQRHTVFAGAFSVWSIYAYHAGLDSKKFRGLLFLVSGLLCLLALLSKETALALPAIIFCYRLLFFDEFKPGWVMRNAKWAAALALFYCLAAAFALRPSMLTLMAHEIQKYQFTPFQRLLTEPRVLLWYLVIIIFPAPQLLSVERDFAISKSLFHPAATMVGIAIILALAIAAVFAARQRKFFSFAVVWYLGMLFVESMPLPIDLAFDHRLYLASLSLIVPAASWPMLKLKSLRPAIWWMAVIVFFFAIFGLDRNLVLRNPEKLWKDAVAKAPGSYRSWYNYCTLTAEAGKCQSAIKVCYKAIALAPAYYRPHHNLGICYVKLGRPDLAEKELLTAAELSKGETDASYFNLALLYSSQKEFEKSIKWYQEALKVRPDNARTHYFFGLNYHLMQRDNEAMEEMGKALKLDPGLSDARVDLATILVSQGRCGDSYKLIQSAPAPDPRLQKIKDFCQAR